MAQTVLSMVIEVRPQSTGLLQSLVSKLRDDEESTVPKYAHLSQAAPLLHFMSMSVCADDSYDPVFVLEVNFDGPPGPFWAQLEAAIGPRLRDMLRCAKPPTDGAAAVFAAVTAEGSTAPVAPLLEARAVVPAVFHQGNRGLARQTIEREAALFLALRPLADAPDLRALSPVEIHARLRGSLLEGFPWLGAPAAPRVTATEDVADWSRLIGFVLAAIAALLAPTLILERAFGYFSNPVAILGLAATLAGIVVWLRLLERADPSQDAPTVDPAAMRRIARAEDQTVQNHMISIVHIKPGILRAVLVRAGLWGLGFALRVFARDGYLGSMRTIHFAHWAIINNGGRLMFHSNFDSSWESYLDDFIEKANVGLTLAWTNGVGFPPTRFLILEGATHGRQFKAWARHSMTESLFWFSAYPALTVNQIERQARLAGGLRQSTMNAAEAATWLLDL
jgi:hypothetical protein